MPDAPRSRPGLIAGVLLALSAVLIAVAATGWAGPVPAAVTLAVVFLGPGVGWQNLRGTLRFTPLRLGLASATSIGCVIVLGLVMNGLSVPLTKPHWAAALAIVLIVIAAATAVNSSKHAGLRRRQAAEAPRRLAATAVAATCAALVAGGVGLAWASQQHWLSGQHYTELYARGSAGREVVTVHNEEGAVVTYQATIAAAGQAPAVASFTLANGGTWTRLVAVQPGQAASGQAMLTVTLTRSGFRGVYRSIRLLRPQPTSPPSP